MNARLTSERRLLTAVRMRGSIATIVVLLLGCSGTRDREEPPASARDAAMAPAEGTSDAASATPPAPTPTADSGAEPRDAGSPADPDAADAALSADAAHPRDAGPPDGCVPIDDPCAEGSVVHGDVTLSTPEDVAALSGVTCIDGNVRLDGDAIVEVELPSLRRITGNVLGQFLGGLETIELACVERVEDFVLIGNDRLRVLRMPRLVRSHRIAVRGGTAFETLDVGALERADSISLFELPSLTEVDLSRLSIVMHSVEAANLERLVTLRLGALRTAEWVGLTESAALEALELPQLETGSLLVEDAPALRTLSAPALQDAESVQVYGARALEIVRLTALRSVDDDLRLAGATASTELDLGALERVRGSLEISFSRMPVLALPRLTSVGDVGLGFIAEGDLAVSDTDVGAIDAPVLTTVFAQLRITRNDTLTRLDLPTLTAGLVTITDNPRLPQCAIERRFAALGAHVEGNDTTAACDELLPAHELGCSSCRDHFRQLVDPGEICVVDGAFRVSSVVCLGCPVALVCRATVRDGDAHAGAPHVDLAVQADACNCTACEDLTATCPLPDDLDGVSPMGVWLNGELAFTLPAGATGCFTVAEPRPHTAEPLCDAP